MSAKHVIPGPSQLKDRLEADPDSLVFGRLADHYRKIGEIPQAIELCRTGLERHPDYVTGHIILGRCHLELSDIGSALESFRSACRLDRRNHLVLKMLADLYARQNDHQLSGDLARTLLCLDPWADGGDGEMPSAVAPVVELLGLSNAAANEPELMGTVSSDHLPDTSFDSPFDQPADDALDAGMLLDEIDRLSDMPQEEASSYELPAPAAYAEESPSGSLDPAADLPDFSGLTDFADDNAALGDVSTDSSAALSVDDIPGFDAIDDASSAFSSPASFAEETVPANDFPDLSAFIDEAPPAPVSPYPDAAFAGPDLMDLLADDDIVDDATAEYSLPGSADLLIASPAAESPMPSGDDVAAAIFEAQPPADGLLRSDEVASRLDEMFAGGMDDDAAGLPFSAQAAPASFPSMDQFAASAEQALGSFDDFATAPDAADPFADRAVPDTETLTPFALQPPSVEDTATWRFENGTIVPDEAPAASLFEAQPRVDFSSWSPEPEAQSLPAAAPEGGLLDILDADDGDLLGLGDVSGYASAEDPLEPSFAPAAPSRYVVEPAALPSSWLPAPVEESNDAAGELSSETEVFDSFETSALNDVSADTVSLSLDQLLNAEDPLFAEMGESPLPDPVDTQSLTLEQLLGDDDPLSLGDDVDAAGSSALVPDDTVQLGSRFGEEIDRIFDEAVLQIPDEESSALPAGEFYNAGGGTAEEPFAEETVWHEDDFPALDPDDTLEDVSGPVPVADDADTVELTESISLAVPEPAGFNFDALGSAEALDESSMSGSIPDMGDGIDDLDIPDEDAPEVPVSEYYTESGDGADASELSGLDTELPDISSFDTADLSLDISAALEPSALGEVVDIDIGAVDELAVPDEEPTDALLSEYYTVSGEDASTLPASGLDTDDDALASGLEAFVDTVDINTPDDAAIADPVEELPVKAPPAAPAPVLSPVIPDAPKPRAARKPPAAKKPAAARGENRRSGDSATLVKLENIPDHVLTPTLADIYFQQDQPYLALEIYKRLFSRDSDNPRLEKRIAQVEAEIRRREAESALSGEYAAAESSAPKAGKKSSSAKKAEAARPLKGIKIKKNVKERIKKAREKLEGGA